MSFSSKELIIRGVVLVVLGTMAASVIYRFMNYMESHVENFEGSTVTVTVTYYFMEGCPHCKSMMPEWQKFEGMADKSNGAIVAKKVSADEDEQKIAKARPKVSGFPTIHISYNGKVEEYQGERKASAIMAAVKKMQA